METGSNSIYYVGLKFLPDTCIKNSRGKASGSYYPGIWALLVQLQLLKSFKFVASAQELRWNGGVFVVFFLLVGFYFWFFLSIMLNQS